MKNVGFTKLLLLIILIVVNVYLCITPSSAFWLEDIPKLENETTYIEVRERLDFIHCDIVKLQEQLEIIKPFIKINYNVSETYKNSKYYQNLTAVEDIDTRTNIVNIAKSQLGYIEGNNSSDLSGEKEGKYNRTEYGYWYGMQDEWCAMFVSWCANLAGDTNVPKHALCSAGLKNFMKNGLAHSREDIANGLYIPQPGDIIYYCNRSDSGIKLTTHVGIVIEYKDGKIYTIEGNTTPNDKSINCGGIVETKCYSINNKYVVYICELV